MVYELHLTGVRQDHISEMSGLSCHQVKRITAKDWDPLIFQLEKLTKAIEHLADEVRILKEVHRE